MSCRSLLCILLLCMISAIFTVRPTVAQIESGNPPALPEDVPAALQPAQQSSSVTLKAITSLGGVGYDLYLDGTTLYVGEGHSVVVYDVTNPAQPARIKRIVTSTVVNALDKEGSRLYIAENAGLTIVDLANPHTPTIIGRYATPSWAGALFVTGTLVYLGFGDWQPGSVHILDVTTPSAPVVLSTIPVISFVTDIAVSAGIAAISYAESLAFTNGMLIVNVANPTAPVQLHDRRITPYAENVQIVNNRAYLQTSAGVDILDMTTPAKPTLIGQIIADGGAGGMLVIDNTLYLRERRGPTNFLYKIDVSNPARPQIRTTTPIGFSVGALTAAGDTVYAFAAGNIDGVQILDMRSDPATVIGEIRTIGPVNAVQMVDDRLYAMSSRGLSVFTLTNGITPTLIGRYDGAYWMMDLQIVGTRAYLSYTEDRQPISGGLVIIDMSDPTSPTLIGTYQVDSKVRAFDVVGNTIYLGLETWPGFQIVDISDPENPMEGDNIEAYVTNSIEVIDGIAYVAGAKLWMIDVNNREQLSFKGNYDRSFVDIAIVGDTLYGITQSPAKLEIVNISDPANPTWQGSLTIREYSRGIEVRDGQAYIIDYGSLTIVDVTDPTAPRRRVFYDLSMSPNDLVLFPRVEPDAAFASRAVIAGLRSSLFIADLAGYDLRFPLVRR